MSARVQRRDAEILRQELNCNMVRCSHYPQSEAFYDACDELGLMAWEEIPGWGYFGDAAWQAAAYRDVRDMIIRDRNHPSIIVWGVMPNEAGEHATEYTAYHELARSVDDSRATGGDGHRADASFVFDVYGIHDYSHRIGPDGLRQPELGPPADAAGKPYLVCEAVGTLSGPAKHYRRVDSQDTQQGQAAAHARVHDIVWDAWLHPAHLEGQTAGEEPPVRLTRNGVSYEMALLAVSRAMGDAMPQEFAVACRGDHPETGPHPQPAEGPAGQRARSAPLPMSYARYLIRGDGLGLALHCSGRTGGVSGDNGTELKRLQDGDSLDTLIRWADEHRARCEWAVCPADEREHPELTAQKRAEVHLKGTWDWQARRSFAKLHRLDHNMWDARLHPAHLEGSIVREEPPLLLTPDGVSYETALAAVFRAMGGEMPEKLAVVYLYDRPQGDPPGA